MDKSHHNIPDHIKKYINPKKKETAPGQYVYQGKWVRENEIFFCMGDPSCNLVLSEHSINDCLLN